MIKRKKTTTTTATRNSKFCGCKRFDKPKAITPKMHLFTWSRETCNSFQSKRWDKFFHIAAFGYNFSRTVRFDDIQKLIPLPLRTNNINFMQTIDCRKLNTCTQDEFFSSKALINTYCWLQFPWVAQFKLLLSIHSVCCAPHCGVAWDMRSKRRRNNSNWVISPALVASCMLLFNSNRAKRRNKNIENNILRPNYYSTDSEIHSRTNFNVRSFVVFWVHSHFP